MITFRNHRKCRSNQAQTGLSIVELLISMALGVTLMAGVVQVFVGMQSTDRSQESTSRIQETGRFAFNFLSQDIRAAGYIGCSSTMNQNSINIPLNAPAASFQPTTGIQGWEANGTDFGTKNTSVENLAVVASNNGNWASSQGNVLDVTNVVPGTDILKVWGVDTSSNGGSQGILVAMAGAATPSLTVTNSNISAGDMVVLSDCEFADIVQPCSVAPVTTPPSLVLSIDGTCAPGNIGTPNIRVDIGADVLKLTGTTYYVGKRNNSSTNPPSLFRQTLGSSGIAGTPEELVEGVENMQILYGENINNDSNNAADRYVPADQVSDWTKVVSARISLLVHSLANNLAPEPQSYNFHGVAYDGDEENAVTGDLPSDGKLRRVFTTTISLRNRTL